MHPYGTKLSLTCAHCGKPFERYASQQKSKIAYCSKVCRAADIGIRHTIPIDARLWSKVDKSGDCWLWTGGRNMQGYGVISKGGHVSRKMLAHRLAYELANGPIPEGLNVCHRCDTPLCVNPAHLFLGTQKENLEDMWRKGRQRGQFQPGANRLTSTR